MNAILADTDTSETQRWTTEVVVKPKVKTNYQRLKSRSFFILQEKVNTILAEIDALRNAAVERATKLGVQAALPAAPQGPLVLAGAAPSQAASEGSAFGKSPCPLRSSQLLCRWRFEKGVRKRHRRHLLWSDCHSQGHTLPDMGRHGGAL